MFCPYSLKLYRGLTIMSTYTYYTYLYCKDPN